MSRDNNEDTKLKESRDTVKWRKLVPGKKVTLVSKLPWVRQLVLHFLTKVGEPFT